MKSAKFSGFLSTSPIICIHNYFQIHATSLTMLVCRIPPVNREQGPYLIDLWRPLREVIFQVLMANEP